MGHNNIRICVRRRKVAAQRAHDRKFTTTNCTIPKTEKNIYQVPWDTITDKLTRFNVGKSVAGTYWLQGKKGELTPLDYSWKYQKHPQVKSLKKQYKKKYYCKRSHDIRKIIEYPSYYTAFKNWPYIMPKLNKVEYAEKLVQHKLAKWERKNPKPIKDDKIQQDLFEKDFLTPWNKAREAATERIRDFVISVYDKLELTGRFKINKTGSAQYQEQKIAEIKDINGDGHNVNELKKDSKLLKKAQVITNKAHSKNPNLVCTNLKDHKKKRGRIILPKAA